MSVRTPRQERSKETKAKIIEVAIRLFAEKGYYKTNSKEIAREAGIAIGSFYAYFKDKKALFIEVIKKYLEMTEAGIFEMQDNWIHEDKRAYLASILQKLFKAHAFYPEIYQEIIVMSYTDDDIRMTYETYCKEVIKNLRSMIYAIDTEIRIKDKETAIIIIMSMLENIIHRTRFLMGEIDDERYVVELTDIICRYLFE